MPIKTGRIRRKFDTALQSRNLSINCVFMGIAYLNYQIEYNNTLSDSKTAKYEEQRSTLAKFALNNGIEKEYISNKVKSISKNYFPSDRQIELLIEVTNSDIYNLIDNCDCISDTDLQDMSAEEAEERNKLKRINRKAAIIEEEKILIKIYRFLENEILYFKLNDKMKIRIQELKKGDFDYNVILKAFYISKKTIINSFNNYTFDSDVHKFNLALSIAKKSFNTALMQIKAEERAEENLLHISYLHYPSADYQVKSRKVPEELKGLW